MLHAKMAQDVGMALKYCSVILPCLACFWGFHSRMDLFLFRKCFCDCCCCCCCRFMYLLLIEMLKREVWWEWRTCKGKMHGL